MTEDVQQITLKFSDLLGGKTPEPSEQPSEKVEPTGQISLSEQPKEADVSGPTEQSKQAEPQADVSNPTEQSVPETPQEEESGHEVEVRFADPNSPLYSAKTFEELGLTDELLKGIYAMKFDKPSKIQERALPLLMESPQNLIAQSQSGTGKTGAFVLSLLSKVDVDKKAPQGICLSPTTELAYQIYGVAMQMKKYTEIDVQLVTRDTFDRTKPVKAHIIIGTPGTIEHAIKINSRGQHVGNIKPTSVKLLVLDEADTMIKESRGNDMVEQTMRIKNKMPSSCQKALFSATFPEEHRPFFESFAPNPNMILLKADEEVTKDVDQYYVDCDDANQKLDYVIQLISELTSSSMIIFCNTRDEVDMVYEKIYKAGLRDIGKSHGNLTPEDRRSAMEDFISGKHNTIICTDVLSRGIDVRAISTVINYSLPRTRNNGPDYQTYTHRIGRTGRFGVRGLSISFVDSKASHMILEAIMSRQKIEIALIPSESLILQIPEKLNRSIDF